MRSYLLILGSVALLGVGFFAYLWLIPSPVHHASADRPGPTALPVSGGNPKDPFSMGAGAWVNVYDKKSDDLTARFRTKEYLPKSDGTYHLTRPEADLYQHDGQIIHLLGAEGDVRMGEAAQHSGMNGGAMGMPTWGVLQDVTVTVFPNAAAQDSLAPDITIHMDNAEFDNDTFRLYTTPVVDPLTGKIVLQADDVPVTLVGKDLDFDGTGLILHWNEYTRDLRSLEVNKGHRLRLKNASAMNGREKPSPTTLPGIVPGDSSAARDDGATPEKPSPQKASAVQAPINAAAPAPASTRPAGPRQYIATFLENVRVVQGNADRVHADQMQVTFARRGDSQPDATPATMPTEHAASSDAGAVPGPAAPRPAAISPATAPSAPLIASAPAVHGPASQPGQEPVDVFWTGPLTIVPAPASVALLPGQSIVHFTGTPVHIMQDDMDLVGEQVRYNTANGVARLSGVPGHPLKMIRKKPDGTPAATVITDGSVRYSQATQLAVFTGAGTATFPDPNKPDTELRTAWSKSCLITLDGNKGEPAQIKRAELQGDASVIDGPPVGVENLKLTAGNIAVDFARSLSATRPVSVQPETRSSKPATRQSDKNSEPAPTVRQVVATGDARCVIRQGSAPPKSIETDQLTIQTATDPLRELYPRFIIADGSVHASDGTQDLRSHRLDVTLAPVPPERRKATTRATDDSSRVELETLLATGDVHASGKDGSTAVGDALHVETIDGEPLITLIGDPPAVVAGSGGVLRGPVIELKPHSNWAAVPGAGTIDGTQAGKPGSTPKPIHVKWNGDLKGDGDANEINLTGGVTADTKDPRGTVNSGSAEHVILSLQPSTRPSTRPAHVHKTPSTQPSGGLEDAKVDFMKDKQIRLVTLLDNAQINSLLTAPDGSVLRRAHITGQRILVYVLEKKLVVPVKGGMLLEDHMRPVAPGHPTTEPVDDGPPGGKGATAFQWEQQFTFDQIAQQAIMDGPVVIVHQPDGPHAEPTRLTADRVITDFEPADVKPEAKSATRPADDDDSPPLKLKRMRAEGNVTIFSKNTTIHATDVTYDPIAEVLIARGREGAPVTVDDGKGGGETNFREVQLNTRTNEIKSMVDISGQAR